MSNKVAIITDSTVYLPGECIQQYQISVTPLSVIWDDKVYRDGVDILPVEFYTRLANSKTMPTTSQVTPDAGVTEWVDSSRGEIRTKQKAIQHIVEMVAERL